MGNDHRLRAIMTLSKRSDTVFDARVYLLIIRDKNSSNNNINFL